MCIDGAIVADRRCLLRPPTIQQITNDVYQYPSPRTTYYLATLNRLLGVFPQDIRPIALTYYCIDLSSWSGIYIYISMVNVDRGYLYFACCTLDAE